MYNGGEVPPVSKVFPFAPKDSLLSVLRSPSSPLCLCQILVPASLSEIYGCLFTYTSLVDGVALLMGLSPSAPDDR
jgi:hypothetical protein